MGGHATFRWPKEIRDGGRRDAGEVTAFRAGKKHWGAVFVCPWDQGGTVTIGV